MNINQVISHLQQKYPGKAIIKNDDSNPTEIICEIEPTSAHPDHSIAIAVIDHSLPHYHQKTREIYQVLQGELKLFLSPSSNLRPPELISGSQIYYTSITLKAGDTYTINPGNYHYATGNESWVQATSHPGWTLEDHLSLS